MLRKNIEINSVVSIRTTDGAVLFGILGDIKKNYYSMMFLLMVYEKEDGTYEYRPYLPYSKTPYVELNKNNVIAIAETTDEFSKMFISQLENADSYIPEEKEMKKESND